MLDHGLDLLVPYLIADRHREAEAARAAATVSPRSGGLRAGLAIRLARLALAIHPEAVARSSS